MSSPYVDRECRRPAQKEPVLNDYFRHAEVVREFAEDTCATDLFLAERRGSCLE